jgi:hypothetical protein
MEILGGPFLTFLLDLLARTFISWGIVSVADKVQLVQLLNTVVVGVIMLVPSLLGIWKIVDLKKFNVKTSTTVSTPTASQTVATETPVAEPQPVA